MHSHSFTRVTVTLIVLLVIVVSVCLVLAWKLMAPSSSPSYYAVYLDTGDLYFGALSRFPYLSLTDVWYIQASQEEVAVNPFADVVWGPGERVRLNPDHVVWMNKLDADSPLVQQLRGRLSAQESAVVPPDTNSGVE